MDYLTLILLGVLNSEPEDSAYYFIADYLLKNIGSLDQISSSGIADQCNVSKATISRFCKYIGLLDFLDLQLLCRNSSGPLNNKFDFPHSSEETDCADMYLEQSARVLEEIRKQIDIKQLEQLAKEIHKYPKVAAFGHMQSGNVAFNLQHDMTANKKYIYSSHRFGRQKEYILEAGSDTLIIIFSATGRYFEHAFGKNYRYKQKKAKIVMITVSDKDIALADQTISVINRCDYSTSLLALQIYESLIALKYHELYGDH